MLVSVRERQKRATKTRGSTRDQGALAVADLEKTGMRADDYANKWAQGGHMDMGRYRKTGSGLHLFRAYIKRREADEQIVEARREKLTSKLQGNLSSWKPSDGYEALTAWQANDGYISELGELLMLDILDSLDPIIEELLKF